MSLDTNLPVQPEDDHRFDQIETQSKFNLNYDESLQTDYESDDDDTNGSKKGWVITFVIILVLGLVASILNPPVNDSRKLVKEYLIYKIDDASTQKLQENKAEQYQYGLSNLFINVLGPHALDFFINIHVNNWVVFSYFDATYNNNGSDVKVLYGIIVFGKVVPLGSDIK